MFRPCSRFSHGRQSRQPTTSFSDGWQTYRFDSRSTFQTVQRWPAEAMLSTTTDSAIAKVEVAQFFMSEIISYFVSFDCLIGKLEACKEKDYILKHFCNRRRSARRSSSNTSRGCPSRRSRPRVSRSTGLRPTPRGNSQELGSVSQTGDLPVRRPLTWLDI